MAKKSFEKKASYEAAALYWIKRFGEWVTSKTIEVYKQLAEYWEKQADLYKLKFIISFVFVLLEAIVIWILAYFL